MTDFRYDDANSLRTQFFYGTRWDDAEDKWVASEALKNEGVTPSWHGVTITDDVSREDLAEMVRTLYSMAEDREVHARRLHRRLENAEVAFATVGKIARAAARAQDWCDEYEQNIAKMCNQINDATFANILRENAERRNEYTVTVTVLARNEYSAQDYAYRLTNSTEEYGVRVTGDPTTALKQRATVVDEDEDESVDEVSF